MMIGRWHIYNFMGMPHKYPEAGFDHHTACSIHPRTHYRSGDFSTEYNQTHKIGKHCSILDSSLACILSMMSDRPSRSCICCLYSGMLRIWSWSMRTDKDMIHSCLANLHYTSNLSRKCWYFGWESILPSITSTQAVLQWGCCIKHRAMCKTMSTPLILVHIPTYITRMLMDLNIRSSPPHTRCMCRSCYRTRCRTGDSLRYWWDCSLSNPLSTIHRSCRWEYMLERTLCTCLGYYIECNNRHMIGTPLELGTGSTR